MKWSTTPPTEFGYYWWRDGPDDDLPELLRLYLSPAGLMVPNESDPAYVSPPEDLGGEWWLERIQEPK